MFSGEIYYYSPLNSVDKSLVKHRFSLHNLIGFFLSQTTIINIFEDIFKKL